MSASAVRAADLLAKELIMAVKERDEARRVAKVLARALAGEYDASRLKIPGDERNAIQTALAYEVPK